MSCQTEKEIILHHQGPVRFETISDLIHDLKQVMGARGVRHTTFKKVLMVMIEALENILKYHEYFEDNSYITTNYSPKFIIEKCDDKFIISSSNPVLNKDIPQLKKRIQHINDLDREGIKELYKHTITDGRFSKKGGAGLGIIEMAKISEGKIDYKFLPIDDNYSYYNLCVTIKET